MKQLRYISIISFILFFYTGAEESTGPNVITDHITFIDTYDKIITLMYDDGCECIKYDCGCCTDIEWHAVSLKGRRE